ncbi:XkdQ/YqbQ family protein, partial [Rhodanobacter denitrificans]|uniref:XkdQ/YqbQ family protein n=1 Tax=Rhodanobacter denitrificans TaxID=666685 RepID=UPI0019309BAB
MEFAVETDGKIYEISELVTSVSYTDKLNDGCSKLEFSYINGGLVIENGSIIRFKYNDANIFYGYVFKREENKKGEVSVTAYDQLRY